MSNCVLRIISSQREYTQRKQPFGFELLAFIADCSLLPVFTADCSLLTAAKYLISFMKDPDVRHFLPKSLDRPLFRRNLVWNELYDTKNSDDMKRILTMSVLVMASALAFGQENVFTLSGGYASSNIEETDVTGKGWRINALYELNPGGGRWSHGFSFGFVKTVADFIEGLNTSSYDANNWPIYYAPKFVFTKGPVEGYVKSAFGVHFSSIERSGALGPFSGNDFGLTAGGGLGMMYSFNEKIFVNAEYEALWLSNSYLGEGLLCTAGLGVGIRF